MKEFTKEELKKNTKKELLELAKKYNLKKLSRLRKAELIDKIIEEIKPEIKKQETKEKIVSKNKKGKEIPIGGNMEKEKYTKSELAKLLKKELLDIAAELNIPNVKYFKKADIIDKILEVSKSPEKVSSKTKPKKLEKDGKDSIETEVGTTKYELSEPKYVIEPSYPIETRELPEEYGDTKIVLMIRDPYWAFVYWEISPEKRKELGLEKYQHSKQLLLRIYDVSDISFDGFNANSSFDIEVTDYAASWYINLPSANKSYCVDLGYLDDKGNFNIIARSNVVKTPRDSVSDIIDEEWMVVDDYFNNIYKLSGGYRIHELMGSENISKIMEENLQNNMSSGALSSGAVASFSNVPKEEKKKEKPFWLIVNTELIVYGATEPDAKVTIQGKEIKLNPDGTFSLRFALPDGEQIIPVKAVNSDGDQEREITPIVKKQTK